MKRTAFYIDGFNFYYSAVKGTPLRWLNFQALFQRLFPKNQIAVIKYFAAEVSDLPDNPKQSLRQQVYWRALETLPNFNIYTEHFLTTTIKANVVKPPPKTIKVYKTEEKGSDVNIESHLLMDGFCDVYDCAIVVSGDSDLVTPIKMVREELKKPIGVLNPQRLSGSDCRKERKSAGLRHAASFYKKGITWGQLEKSKFSDQIKTPKGIIHCPDRWK
ncbi:MAG: NYN domain-containing protein [Kiritimatiellales bacterium]